MKKIFWLYIIAFSGLLTACGKKLDVNPRAELTPEMVTSDDVQLLINGVYSVIKEGNTDYFFLSFLTEDLSADNLVYRATFFQHGEVDNNAMLANNVLIARYFNAPYAIIQSANDVIDLVGTSTTIPEATKAVYLGEVKMLRAFAYYKLVTLFGGVPIIETRDPDLQLVPRNTEDEIWNYIIEDLKYAAANGPAFSDATKASKDFAKSLLARVYLIRGNNSEAKTLAEEVIANTASFELADNYDEIFDKGTKEHIFYVNHTVTDGSGMHGYFTRAGSMPGSGRAELPVDTSLVNSYEPGDVRKDASVVHLVISAYDPKFHWFCNKYRDPGDMTSPYYITRVAEMYLISAEASYKISNNTADIDALKRINELRAKRGLGALASIDLQKISKERRVELAFEGVRWTDMKRIPSVADPYKSEAQVFVEKKGRTKNDLLYPIPTPAIDVNPKLDQNPGY